MAGNVTSQGPVRAGTPGTGGGRPGLVPATSMPVWLALLQVAILLGIPMAILLIAKPILRHYFPELGY